MKKILLLFVIFNMTFMYSQTFDDGILSYSVLNGLEATVTGGASGCPTGVLIIPATIDYNSITYSVTDISDSAFYNCTGLTSVIFPSSLVSMQDNAFDACTGLTGILTLPESLTTIEDRVFTNCTGLTSIDFPASLMTLINNHAFSGCTGLTSIDFPASTTFGQAIFQSCTGLTSINFPASTTSINYLTFSGCTGLTGTLTLPSSLTTIRYGAFTNCTGLTGIELPASVTTIEDEAFSYCIGLTSIKVMMTTPPTITSAVFIDVDKNTTSLMVPSGSVSAYGAAIGWQDFNNITLSVQDIALTKGLTLYPNPAKNTLFLEVALAVDIKEIIVYNMLGKQVLSGTSAQIDISGLSEGMFVLKLETTNGIAVKRFIKK
ncbi:leucine-rich repeat domain-containing protein [Psychroserpens jangbogonensis]|uniref:leucine-rich repeat domain-containing protein n=1 Tax=Psychroserpens jangbogonensis TaxID=1484460 RepID=UPI00068D57DE|nr:leucine-rich repeat domain-containing protein [Psychroserpens jangbogonensis]